MVQERRQTAAARFTGRALYTGVHGKTAQPLPRARPDRPNARNAGRRGPGGHTGHGFQCPSPRPGSLAPQRTPHQKRRARRQATVPLQFILVGPLRGLHRQRAAAFEPRQNRISHIRNKRALGSASKPASPARRAIK